MKRGTGTIFKIMAIVIWAIGGIAAFLLIFPAIYWGYEIYILYIVLTLLGSCVLGMIFFGFGEIIHLLQDIDYAISKNNKIIGKRKDGQ